MSERGGETSFLHRFALKRPAFIKRDGRDRELGTLIDFALAHPSRPPCTMGLNVPLLLTVAVVLCVVLPASSGSGVYAFGAGNIPSCVWRRVLREYDVNDPRVDSRTSRARRSDMEISCAYMPPTSRDAVRSLRVAPFAGGHPFRARKRRRRRRHVHPGKEQVWRARHQACLLRARRS